ncbi:MAG TPA: hypothetical protein VJZ70_02720 [Limnochordia bacterium]|nr:hypothetical protein [Limnochordia bacterium]
MGKEKKKRLVKALVVKADLNVQKTGRIQVAAPLGVRVDPNTGEVETPLELKLLGQPVFTPTIVPDKLINHGLQKACLLVHRPGGDCKLSISSKTNLDIPIYGMHDIPCIQAGDHIQETAEVESIDIRGIKDPGYQGCETKNMLIITVVYKIKVVIAREELIRIPKHCDHTDEDCCIQEAKDQDTIINKNDIKIIVNPPQHSSRRV